MPCCCFCCICSKKGSNRPRGPPSSSSSLSVQAVLRTVAFWFSGLCNVTSSSTKSSSSTPTTATATWLRRRNNFLLLTGFTFVSYHRDARGDFGASGQPEAFWRVLYYTVHVAFCEGGPILSLSLLKRQFVFSIPFHDGFLAPLKRGMMMGGVYSLSLSPLSLSLSLSLHALMSLCRLPNAAAAAHQFPRFHKAPLANRNIIAGYLPTTTRAGL